MDPRSTKLLNLALHPETPGPEADAAAVALIRHWRASGFTSLPVDPVFAFSEPPPPGADWRALVPTPTTSKRRYDADADTTLRMPWGKYRGQRVGWIYRKDRGYLEWLLLNAEQMPGSLRDCIEQALGVAEPETQGSDTRHGHKTEEDIETANFFGGSQPSYFSRKPSPDNTYEGTKTENQKTKFGGKNGNPLTESTVRSAADQLDLFKSLQGVSADDEPPF